MKKLIILPLLVFSFLFVSCDEKDCPEDMDKCTLKDGTTICAPKGKC